VAAAGGGWGAAAAEAGRPGHPGELLGGACLVLVGRGGRKSARAARHADRPAPLYTSAQCFPPLARPLRPPLQGHAFEARLYAENPENNFLPAGGRCGGAGDRSNAAP
jgi:hypothetical protein